ncbi:hypothetical protein [Nocardia rhizosphaerae]|uniref:Uncharacterized protein n=1 Tax=Nocardia rhizosphaerae TaxID=1691571 RepID=A0ABV8LC85_9NOCA
MSGHRSDARALLGMDTSGAWLVAGLYLCALASLMISSWGDVAVRWPLVAAFVVAAGGTAVLLIARSDPLALTPTICATATIPGSVLLVLSTIPFPPTVTTQVAWPQAAGTAIATFLCVRGRTAAAWLGMGAMIALHSAWSARHGAGAAFGFVLSFINLGPLLMATFFAYTIRPAAAEIFTLHEESAKRTAVAAAAEATLAERHDQAVALDRLVRPVLVRIAGPDQLVEADRAECRALEAQLRDALRAPALATGPVVEAARAARDRGVEVVLVDDYGSNGADIDADLYRRLRGLVTTELRRAAAGSVVVRVLPPGRATIATLVVTDPDQGVRRVEIDGDGTPREISDAGH